MKFERLENPPEIPADTQLTEGSFYHYCKIMTFAREEIAFVMVDLWNTGFGAKPLSHLGWEAEYNGGKSHCDRAGEIERTCILPMLTACRKTGLTVIHAPTGNIAIKHRQWRETATEEEKDPLILLWNRRTGLHLTGCKSGARNTFTSSAPKNG